MTMYTYHTVVRKHLDELGFDTSVFSYDKFRTSWYNYLRILEIDYQTAFSCSECKDNPEIVLGDGTAFGFQLKYMDIMQDAPSFVGTDKNKATAGSKYR